MKEFFGLLKGAGYQPQVIPGIALGLLMFIISYLIGINLIEPKYLLLVMPLALLLAIFELFRKKEQPVINLALTFFAVLYLSLPLSLMNLMGLSNTPESIGHRAIIIGVFILIWTADTAAYVFGVSFGKHRLFERISPKKSWEGFIGGFVLSMVAAIILSVFMKNIALIDWIVIAFIVSVIGTLGDLLESLIKRSLNIKDSGSILPGHGGILDRLDSLLFTMPFIVAYLLLFNRIA
jgi:phosphatidate cytidylyltransferase